MTKACEQQFWLFLRPTTVQPLPNLRVGVLNGIVHLAGVVDSLPERGAAEELAGQVPGVRGVVNRIEAPGAPSPAREINLDLKQRKVILQG